ncbi:MAG: DNA primase [Clostridiales bacterium]|nr:DNA primase [Clostridiales bacterium]
MVRRRNSFTKKTTIMSIYRNVKQAVSVPQVADRYGIPVDRSGKCCCLFHPDKHPSMKLNDDYYYCFGCQAKGDVISLTEKLFNLSPREAAQKLAADFGLAPSETLKQAAAKKSAKRAERDEREYVLSLLNKNIDILRQMKENHAPKHPDEPFHVLFVEACKYLEFFQYVSDVLSFGHSADVEAAMKYIKKTQMIQMLEKVLEVKKCQN